AEADDAAGFGRRRRNGPRADAEGSGGESGNPDTISFQEACDCYQISGEELLAWQRAIESHGIEALRIDRLQTYRTARPQRPLESVKREAARSLLGAPLRGLMEEE